MPSFFSGYSAFTQFHSAFEQLYSLFTQFCSASTQLGSAPTQFNLALTQFYTAFTKLYSAFVGVNFFFTTVFKDCRLADILVMQIYETVAVTANRLRALNEERTPVIKVRHQTPT